MTSLPPIPITTAPDAPKDRIAIVREWLAIDNPWERCDVLLGKLDAATPPPPSAWVKCDPDDPGTYPPADVQLVVVIDPRPGATTSRPFRTVAHFCPGEFPHWRTSTSNWRPECVSWWQLLPPLPGEQPTPIPDPRITKALAELNSARGCLLSGQAEVHIGAIDAYVRAAIESLRGIP